MVAPLLTLTNGCCGTIPKECCGSKAFIGKVLIASAVFDLLASITCLVVSVLALTAVISLPPAATYGLLGGSVSIVLSYVLSCMISCCKTEGNK